MLPMPGVFRFPWEFSSGAVQPGETLRTYGRLACYKAEESEATLTAHDGTSDCQVCVCTQLVEPFQAITGAPYVTLGEAVRREDGALVLHARVLTCVEGVDLQLLQQAVNEQRAYFLERSSPEAALPEASTGT
ncbi:CST complex subunit TEN1 isoform X2 [Erpetoichthys calabaricus]|uniref:CST complex subunit TEN1 isoform X2 n=1 Tax=Erpetoichthys calabaricus TaxID=27687 RepID=UPI00109F0B7C|nr:CST complex subunit TEN1 isoform X2 [Erpetoichthys calabaricus]